MPRGERSMQLDAELALELLDVVRHAGLRERQRPRRRAERTAVCHLAKHPQTIDVEHVSHYTARPRSRLSLWARAQNLAYGAPRDLNLREAYGCRTLTRAHSRAPDS